MKLRTSIIAATVLGTATLGAQAANEDLAAVPDNNSVANAQFVGTLIPDGFINVFGVRGTTEIFGLPIVDNSDIDFYSFNVTSANQIITLRVDTPTGPDSINDPMVALFSTAGLLLLGDDDGGPGYDSLLSFAVSTPGLYYAAVSGFADFDFNGIEDGTVDGIPNTNFLYNLQIGAVNDPNPVPVPAAGWLLGSALLGFATRRARPAV